MFKHDATPMHVTLFCSGKVCCYNNGENMWSNMRQYADLIHNQLISCPPAEFIPIMVEAFDAAPMISDVVIKNLDGPSFFFPVHAHTTVFVVLFLLHTQNRFDTSR